MSSYRKRPIIVEAVQWFKMGDHPDVEMSRPTAWATCGHEHCGRAIFDHGHIEILGRQHSVCPGDWIITGVAGEVYVVKDTVFQLTYEPVESEEVHD